MNRLGLTLLVALLAVFVTVMLYAPYVFTLYCVIIDALRGVIG